MFDPMQKTAISLLTCLIAFSAVPLTAAAPAGTLDHICAVDGLKYMNVQSAVAACSGSGVAVIPPTYTGTGLERRQRDGFSSPRAREGADTGHRVRRKGRCSDRV